MNYASNYNTNTVASAPADVRMDFIRKVYSLFFASLLVTVGVGAYGAQPGVASVLLPMLPVLLIADFICIIVLSFTRRTTGVNVALLYLFAGIQGAVLGPLLTLVSKVAPGVPAEAAILTIATFGGLSAYVWQSKKDFSYLGGMLFAGIIAMMVAGIVMWFVHSTLLHTIYCVVGIVIFCGYVLYDTSQILNRLGPDEAVAGAVSLYLDFINLFILILNLLMELNRRN